MGQFPPRWPERGVGAVDQLAIGYGRQFYGLGASRSAEPRQRVNAPSGPFEVRAALRVLAGP
ncbi:hypothetical protein GCM10018965_038370 [Nonomuraea roseola]